MNLTSKIVIESPIYFKHIKCKLDRSNVQNMNRKIRQKHHLIDSFLHGVSQDIDNNTE